MKNLWTSVLFLCTLLFGIHTMNAAPIIQSLNKGWTFKQDRLTNWYPATVPGVVHTDLIDNQIIEDPFFRLNERGVQWIDKENWVYKMQFTPDADILKQQHVVLDFKGLDTYADVYLNDSLIISADNMFREWRKEVKSLLKNGQNELRVFFHSPIRHDLYKRFDLPAPYPAGNDQSENGGIFDFKVSIFARKAGYHYGWDWGPRLVTSGIWRPVSLIGWSDARVDNVYYMQPDVTASRAKLNAQVTVEVASPVEDALVQVVDEETNKVLAKKIVNLKAGMQKVDLPFTIRRPKLWWSNGLGEAYRYTFTTKVLQGAKVLDSQSEKIGVRSMKLITKPDEHGTSFYVELNGHPVFCKGANFVPQDNFLPRVTDAQYKETVLAAVQANMNMLRVWGGGIYENDIFYDLCDEYGILVWQDFMFACSLYPTEGALLENCREEAIQNVKRLRNHPSIALWCGNNENNEAWYTWGWKRQFEEKGKDIAARVWKQYTDLFHGVLPEVMGEYAPETAYWPSSPFSKDGQPSNETDGDRHYWSVWHSKEPIAQYNHERSRFFSEYGFQSFPEFVSVKQYAPEKRDWDIYSEVMMAHQRGGTHANGLIEAYMLNEYNRPDNFERFLYVNHVLQGDAIKTAIEAHRRDMPYCMGTLFWQHNDCWPVASWSSRDYYNRWKAQHYFTRKGYKDILISPIAMDDMLRVFVVSDRLKSTRGRLTISLMKFDGEVIQKYERRVRIPANNSIVLFEKSVKDYLKDVDAADVFVHAVFDDGDKTYDNNYVLLKQKDMHYPVAKLTHEVVEVEPGVMNVTITADTFARAVFLQVDDVKSVLSDNYFDLLPGESKTIQVQTVLGKKKFEDTLKIQQLAGS